MSKQLRLGKSTGSAAGSSVTMPVDAITRTFGVFGQRGTGKSTTAAVMVEQIAGVGGRAVVLDPTGVWYGLTRAGTGPGLSGVVLGGEHADAPLNAQSGALVAEFVVNSTYPVIVLDMKLLRKHERQHFAMEFLEALFHNNRDPLMVVFDEAAQFAPTQMREKGDVPRLLGAVEDLIKLGRSRGLGGIMIEQRIATLNANVREQIETMVAHRMIGPLDRKALMGWVYAQGGQATESELSSLISKLKTGHALLWSPVFLDFFGVVEMDNATTFDSRATPKVGQRQRKLTARAPVDLEALKTRMAETIEKAKANDPKALKAEITRLKRELESAGVETARTVSTRVGEAIKREHDATVTALRESRQREKKAAAHIQKLHKLLGSIHNLSAPPDSVPELDESEPTPVVLPVVTRPATVARRVEAKMTASTDAPSGDLPKGEKSVLSVVAQYPAGADRDQITVLTGFKRSTRDTYIQRLRLKGFVTADDKIKATPDGIAALGDDYEPLPTGERLRQYWLDRLPEGEKAVLAVLINNRINGGDNVNREVISDVTGYKRSTRDTYIQRLRSRKLVEDVGRGEVAPSANLFG